MYDRSFERKQQMKKGWENRGLAAVRRGAIVVCVAALLIMALYTGLQTKKYRIESEKISGNVRIVLITDLHSCRYGEEQKELIEAICRQEPDLVMLGGDICDDRISNEGTEELLKGIAHRYPCYYVTGNHEYWSGNIEGILELFETYGVTILDGRCETVQVRNDKINICGVTDPDVTVYTDAERDVQQQLKSLEQVDENGYFTILLAHRPEKIKEYAAYGFDLVLSGHAHGGQWRIPGILNGLYAPNQGIFPKYAGGEYRVDDTQMIVSRGLARENTVVPRIFNPPELVVVDVTG
ncbi:MAG: metallophosphoesterase [Clostridiales bacterium]|nr:metallophosphoesterase [Clostridiales bacterium]